LLIFHRFLLYQYKLPGYIFSIIILSLIGEKISVIILNCEGSLMKRSPGMLKYIS
jgi:hypothetical protein